MKNIEPLIALGAALHWLKPKEKSPIEAEWSSAPRYSSAVLQEKYRKGYNVGIRLGEPSETPYGFIHLIDLDIRDTSQADAAWDKLTELFPGARSLPSVISGSGGESRHLYFFSTHAFRSKKLAKSAGFAKVFDPRLNREVKKNDWEIELFGTGKQAVLPPSIHPDTGQPYVWERELEYDLIEMGVVPMIDQERIAGWGVQESAFEEDEDDLAVIMRQEPIDIDDEQVDEILNRYESDGLDYDEWLTTGMALYHQYSGSEAGFDRWMEWSEKSEKHNPQGMSKKWRSFGDARNPVTMRSLIAVSAQSNLAQEHDFLSDLLGPETPKTGADDDLLDSRPKPAEINLDWRSLLQYTEDGTGIKSTLPNLQLVLKHDPRTAGVANFNLFTQETVLRGQGRKFVKKSPKPIKQLDGDIWAVEDPVNGILWGDIHDHALRALIESQKGQGGYDMKVTDRDLKAAVETVAREHAFHPVREYLSNTEWDGISRVDSMFTDYLGCPNSPYHRSISRLTLIGAVVRVMEPGHKFDFVPILEGLQGKGKSTFIKLLGHSWSTELTGDFSDPKAMVELMQGSWVIEIPELQGFSKAEITDIKAFVSRTSDKVRLAWEKRAKNFPRQCIFIGSTNDQEYLRDSTGGRRFWPVKCDLEGQIDINRFRNEVGQIWAEAYQMYLQMRRDQPENTLPLYLDDPLAEAEALFIQDSRRVETAEDTMAGRIMGWLESPIGTDSGFDDMDADAPKVFRTETCIPQIWEECLGREGAVPHREAIMIGKAMTMIPEWQRSSGKLKGSKLSEKYGGKVRIYTKI